MAEIIDVVGVVEASAQKQIVHRFSSGVGEGPRTMDGTEQRATSTILWRQGEPVLGMLTIWCESALVIAVVVLQLPHGRADERGRGRGIVVGHDVRIRRLRRSL